MDIMIEKGTLHYLKDCEDALLNSKLGEKYFSKAESFIIFRGGAFTAFHIYI